MSNVFQFFLVISGMVGGSTALSGFIGRRTERRTERFERRAGR